MKQNTLKWLSCSLILLVFISSCKKKKGVLDNLDPGKFDYICIWSKDGIQDTLAGEASGAYLQGGEYIFRVRNELEPTNNYFRIGRETGSNPTLFIAPYLPIALTATITSLEHDSDHVWVLFEKGSNIHGSFTLTRK